MGCGEEEEKSTEKEDRLSMGEKVLEKKSTSDVVEKETREDDNEGVDGGNVRDPSKKRGRHSRKAKEGTEEGQGRNRES